MRRARGRTRGVARGGRGDGRRVHGPDAAAQVPVAYNSRARPESRARDRRGDAASGDQRRSNGSRRCVRRHGTSPESRVVALTPAIGPARGTVLPDVRRTGRSRERVWRRLFRLGGLQRGRRFDVRRRSGGNRGERGVFPARRDPRAVHPARLRAEGRGRGGAEGGSLGRGAEPGSLRRRRGSPAARDVARRVRLVQADRARGQVVAGAHREHAGAHVRQRLGAHTQRVQRGRGD